MQVFQTAGDPPRSGSTILAIIGWTTNSRAAPTISVRAKSDGKEILLPSAPGTRGHVGRAAGGSRMRSDGCRGGYGKPTQADSHPPRRSRGITSTRGFARLRADLDRRAGARGRDQARECVVRTGAASNLARECDPAAARIGLTSVLTAVAIGARSRIRPARKGPNGLESVRDSAPGATGGLPA